MTRLTAAQIAHLDGMMQARRTRELAEIAAVAQRSHDERLQQLAAGDVGGRQEDALLEIAQATADAVVRQDIQDVRDVAAARARIANGTYGVCVDCGEPIVYERLLAFPTAKRCIRCQRQHELARNRSGQARP